MPETRQPPKQVSAGCRALLVLAALAMLAIAGCATSETAPSDTCPTVAEATYLSTIGLIITDVGYTLVDIADTIDAGRHGLFLQLLEDYTDDLREVLAPRGRGRIATINHYVQQAANDLDALAAAIHAERWDALDRAADSYSTNLQTLLALAETLCDLDDDDAAARTPTATATANPNLRPTARPTPIQRTTVARATLTPSPTASPTATVTLTPSPTATASQAPPAAAGARITVTLTNSGRFLVPYVEADHRIEEMGLQLWVEYDGAWGMATTWQDIEPDVRHALSAAGDVHWQDITNVRAKTLVGATVKTWECERRERLHEVDGRYACVVTDTQQTPSLREATSPDLWVYVANRELDSLYTRAHVIAHARAGEASLRSVTVRVRYGGGFEAIGYSDFCTDGPLGSGELQSLACGGYLDWNGTEALPHHSDTASVRAFSSAVGYLRCDHHVDSTEELSVWACAPWLVPGS